MSHPIQLRRRARQRAKRRREAWETAWRKPGVSAEHVLTAARAYAHQCAECGLRHDRRRHWRFSAWHLPTPPIGPSRHTVDFEP